MQLPIETFLLMRPTYSADFKGPTGLLNHAMNKMNVFEFIELCSSQVTVRNERPQIVECQR